MMLVVSGARLRVAAAWAAAIAMLVVFATWSRPDPLFEQVTFVHVKLARGGSPDAVAASLGPRATGTLEPLFSRSPEALAQDRVSAAVRTRRDVPDLGRWFKVPVSGEVTQVVARLEALPDVSVAFPEPRFLLPGVGTTDDNATCPIKTPSYIPYQGYLGEAPQGVNAPVAWSLPGGTGENVWVADVEGGWNASHEDLPSERITHLGGTRMGDHWEAHGTAVLGEVAARDNGIGMVGIAPGVGRIVTASIGTIGVANALDLAQSELRPGDILIIELQTVGPRHAFAPAEYWDDVFDVVSVATARGVIVVAAAGNGAEDLDHGDYARKFDRGFRDSGAIMVGAGAPAATGYVDRSRLDFSNYGSRVDVQGWGREVATFDYGDLQNCATKDRRYTRKFAGTSSATPVVAGAAILLQSVHKEASNPPLSPTEMRALLQRTGSPQTDGPHGPASEHIGPRPDLARALEALGTHR
jgi:subtilisin family serine protease